MKSSVLSVENGIAVLRPDSEGEEPLWSGARVAALTEQVQSLEKDQAIRALVLEDSDNGLLSRALSETVSKRDKHSWTALARELSRLGTSLRRFPGLSFALLPNGGADIGLELSLCCDFRFACHDAMFRFTTLEMGLAPFSGGSQLLPRLVGEVPAKRMLLLGETLDAREAMRVGLIDGLNERSGLRNGVMGLLGERAHGRQLALRATKQLIEHSRMRPLETGFAAERDWLDQLLKEPGVSWNDD